MQFIVGPDNHGLMGTTHVLATSPNATRAAHRRGLQPPVEQRPWWVTTSPRALSERPDLDLTLVTQVRNRSALEADPIATQARFCFVDNEFIARPLHRLSTRLRGGTSLSWTTNTALDWPAYMVFERQVFRRFSSQFKNREFDLIHRMTPLSPTMGSPLASLVDVPMIIGPLNGGLPWPKEYPELWRQEREWLVPLRDLYKCLPYYRSTYRRLCGVISGSRHTAMEIPAYFTGRRFYHPENGLDPERSPWPTPGPNPSIASGSSWSAGWSTRGRT